MKTMKAWILAGAGLAILAAREGRAQDPKADPLETQIEALKAPRVAWREIPWKACILDGLRESAEKKKPVILWVFIDRPIDDKRC